MIVELVNQVDPVEGTLEVPTKEEYIHGRESATATLFDLSTLNPKTRLFPRPIR